MSQGAAADRHPRPHRRGVDGEPAVRDPRRRVLADLRRPPERDVFRRTARGFVWVAILIAGDRRARSSWLGRHGARCPLPGTFPVAGTSSASSARRRSCWRRRSAASPSLYRVMPPQCAVARRPWPARRSRPAWRSWLLTQAFTFLAPGWSGSAALAGLAGDGVHRPGLVVVPVPGAAVWGGLGQGPRGRAAIGRSRSGDLGGPAASAEPGGGGE